MFRSKKWLDSKEVQRVENTVGNMKHQVLELIDNVSTLRKENEKLKWIIENPPQYKAGDLLNGSVVTEVKCVRGISSGFGWKYNWIDVNKVKY